MRNVQAGRDPCEDAISREAVIEKLKKEDKILYTTTGLNYLIRVIEELPSVTQKSETVTEFADRCRECGAKYGKLLKQELCEDAISRRAVLDKLVFIGGEIEPDELTCIFRDRIKSLPPVKQEPKTVLYSGDGYADGYMVYDMAECPNCGYEYEDGDKDWGLSFCPNCGQKLNWESEEV